MPEAMESRMVRTETKLDNYENTQKAIFEYMRKGHAQREEMVKGFAELAEQSKTTFKYQQDCEAERKAIAARLLSLENSRTRQIGIAAGASSVMTAVIAGVAWLLKGGH